MPIYEYKCLGCSNQFELKRSFGDEAEALCPECEDVAQRLLSAVAIIFKGSGFYTTDSRKKEPESPTPASSPDKA